MDQNRILAIGVPQTSLRTSGLLNAPNFNEFDAIIWHPSNAILEIADKGYPGNLVSAFQAKISTLVDWVALGHSLIVIANPLGTFSYVVGNKQVAFRLDQHEPFIGV